MYERGVRLMGSVKNDVLGIAASNGKGYWCISPNNVAYALFKTYNGSDRGTKVRLVWKAFDCTPVLQRARSDSHQSLCRHQRKASPGALESPPAREIRARSCRMLLKVARPLLQTIGVARHCIGYSHIPPKARHRTFDGQCSCAFGEFS